MRRLLTLCILTTAVLSFTAGAVASAPGQTTFEKLAAVRAELVGVKGDLGYACCIRPSCNFCALSTGMCPCRDGLAGDGVCGECLLGWKAGYGRYPGIEPDEVPAMSGSMLEMMYRLRADSMPDARGNADDAGAADPGHHAH